MFLQEAVDLGIVQNRPVRSIVIDVSQQWRDWDEDAGGLNARQVAVDLEGVVDQIVVDIAGPVADALEAGEGVLNLVVPHWSEAFFAGSGNREPGLLL